MNEWDDIFHVPWYVRLWRAVFGWRPLLYGLGEPRDPNKYEGRDRVEKYMFKTTDPGGPDRGRSED